MTTPSEDRPHEVGINCRTALSTKTGDRTYCLNLLRGLQHLGLHPAQWRFHLLLDQPDENGILLRTKHFRAVVFPGPNSRL